MRDDDPGIGKLGLNLKMGDENISIAQKDKNTKKNDDPDGDLGLTIRMDGESLSIAQRKRLAQLHEHNFLTFTDHPDPEGETQQEKIQRGKQILRAERDDDPGIGKLGLNLKMGDENISIAQKDKNTKKNDDPDGDLGLTIRMDGQSLSIA